MEIGREEGEQLTLVARKPCYGLPTACPKCLPVYIYLKFSKLPFKLEFNLTHPDSDQLPFIESANYVAYNNEKGGVIQNMKEDGIVDLDSEFRGIPEWVSTKAMIESWLADAVTYELWVGSDGKSAQKIYYSDLSWPIAKILYFKQVHSVKQLLGITAESTERREKEIYSRATMAYGTLSSMLGERSFFFENRRTSLDADFLGHVLFTLHALPETSVLKSKLLEHPNLVNYAENLKTEYLDTDSSDSTVPKSDPSSSSKRPSHWSSKPKSRAKRERTEEEKKFRRRSNYFLATQLIATLVFLSRISGSNDADVELGGDDDEDEGLFYE